MKTFDEWAADMESFMGGPMTANERRLIQEGWDAHARQPVLSREQADRIAGALDPTDGGHDAIEAFVLSLAAGGRS